MRPTKDEYFIAMAHLVATRSTCLRRSVGCVLVDANGHVLATGYNGVAAGQPHCNHEEAYTTPTMRGTELRVWHPHVCKGATHSSGTGLEHCEAIHAEQNALLQCHDVQKIHTCYVTHSPCITCAKLLMNTSCLRVVYSEPYTHVEALVYLKNAGKELVQVKGPL